MAKKIEQQLRDELSENLALLAQLSDDVSLKKPTRVKATKLPKYVGGVTESQGNSMYKAELASSASSLGRTFNQQNASSAELDLRREIVSAVGSNKALQPWIDASVQVAIHLVVECAQRATSLLSANTKIRAGLKLYMDEVKKGSIVKGIEAWNSGVKGLNSSDASAFAYPTSGSMKANTTNLKASQVYFSGQILQNYLYPINIAWLRNLDAQVIDIMSNQTAMQSYIGNTEAQRAVINYMGSHSVPTNVILPLEVTNSTDVATAFQNNPGKDLKASYNFYKKAVDASYDMDRSLRTGEVESNIKSAVSLLKSMQKSMMEAGISSSVASQFSKEFNRIASELSRLNIDKGSAQDDITMALLDLVDLTSTSPSVFNTGLSGQLSSLQGGSNFVSLLGTAPTTSVLDAQDLLKVTDISKLVIRNPIVAQLKNKVIQIFLSLQEAYEGLAPMTLFQVGSGGPSAIAPTRLAISDDFKDTINTTLISIVNTADSQITSQLSSVDEIGLAKIGFANAMSNLLGTEVATSLIDQNLGAGSASGAETLLQAGRSGGTSSIAISGQMFREIANSNVAKLSTRLASGNSVEQEALQAIERANNLLTPKLRGASLRKVKSIVLNLTKYASNYLNSIATQARSAGIAIDVRKNPLMSTGAQVGVGIGTLVGDHAVSALMNRFIQPESGSIMAHVSDALPSVATAGYGAMKIQQGDSSLGIPLVSGAVAHLALRYAFKHPAIRFSDNAVLKALQYPTNYVACLAGDLSMGASSVCPADAQAHKENIAEYVNGLVQTNSLGSLAHIGVQLWNSGLNCDMNADGTVSISVGEAQSGNLNNVLLCIAQDKLEEQGFKGKELKVKMHDFVKSAVEPAKKAGKQLTYAHHHPDYVADHKIKPKIAPKTSGFILEPGYNMDVYSGEDQVNYLAPPPIANAQPGFEQLEEAINRATLLSATDKLAEGIDDLQDVAIIRVDPEVARDAEAVGMGVSLGQSRQNPSTELLAIEVEGANGLMQIAPMRQQSVPQGSLNYTKIGHSAEVDVSPRGLFNRGVFTPSFGRQ